MTIRLADYVADFVAEAGVKAVFLVPGGGNMFLADAFGNHSDLEYIPHHHEQAATIAAEAYSRITENIGVALVTTGPGGTNAITGVAGAWIDSVPLMVISGQVKRADLKGETGVRQMGPQEVDIVALVTPITKYAVTVMDPKRIRYELEKALHLARTGRRGPVWVDIPLDIQAAPIDSEALEGYDPTDTSVAAQPIDDKVQQVLDLISQAERPLLLAGQGVRLAGAAQAFRTLAETLNIPAVTTWLAMDVMSSDHPLNVGRPGTVALRAPNFAVQNADLIIAIGARLDNVTTAYNPAKFGRLAKKVMVDIDPAELNKLGDAIDIKVEADAREFIEKAIFASSSSAPQDRQVWLSHCQNWKDRYPVNDGKPFPTSGVIDHYHATAVLADEIPEDTLIVTGSSGLAVEIFYTSFHVKPGQRIFLTSGLGAMGYGLPALIGGGVANGRRPFVAVESDGSLMMNVQELSTIAALQLPVHIFIFNNGGYASIRNTQRGYFQGRYVGTGPEAKLNFPDLRQLAEVHGLEAWSVSDASNLRETVREVLKRPGPVLCEIRLRPEESLQPKSAALPQPDGSILSMPLEDMSPLLSLHELEETMIVPLDPASYKARGQSQVSQSGSRADAILGE
ncbi:thiamine pyrophosphate-binding protein [Roseixanthobacter glucoisosaccharinicivorans]|uniref:thiamine pyrophosphate-binding protein n=1 Tax=Roseixanthobacter glucoisosaccharinicivorans TaxID=3119923 RepID=UPI003727519A